MKQHKLSLMTAVAALSFTIALQGCSRPPGAETTASPPAAPPSPLAAENDEPSVTIDVCGEAVLYAHPPHRVMTHDINITELFMALNLGHLLIGHSGVKPRLKGVDAQYRQQLASLPSLSDRDMNLEAIVDAGVDFVFAGWSYGFRQGGVTPASLQRFGVNTYVLSESCIRIGSRTQVSIEDTFTDLINLGRIFRVEERAQALVAQQRAQLAEISAALSGIDQRPRVFVYDSGEATPNTAGRFAMVNAMIEAAGGHNIFADIDSSWTSSNWEDVLSRDPEFIVIIEDARGDAQRRIDYLHSKAELADVTAIREQRFIALEYAEATPGPRNVVRTLDLAKALHPQRFAHP